MMGAVLGDRGSLGRRAGERGSGGAKQSKSRHSSVYSMGHRTIRSGRRSQ